MVTPIGLNSQSDYVMAQKTLEISTVKHKATAANIANHETPGYQRIHVNKSFSDELKRLAANNRWEEYRDLNPSLGVDNKAPMLRPDGNTVSLEHELMEMSKNTLEFEFAADYMTDSLKRLQTAITGRVQ
jgi:flagellar basal-body rod protein FlgB